MAHIVFLCLFQSGLNVSQCFCHLSLLFFLHIQCMVVIISVVLFILQDRQIVVLLMPSACAIDLIDLSPFLSLRLVCFSPIHSFLSLVMLADTAY